MHMEIDTVQYKLLLAPNLLSKMDLRSHSLDLSFSQLTDSIHFSIMTSCGNCYHSVEAADRHGTCNKALSPCAGQVGVFYPQRVLH